MTLKPRDKALLAGVAAIALVAAFYVLLLKPENRRAAHLQTAIAAQQAALVKVQQQYAAGAAAARLLHSDAAEWTADQRAVPAVSNIPALLRLLQRSAHAANVELDTITLSGGSGSDGPSAPSGTSGGATIVPIALTFRGGYQALRRLVAHLDRLVVLDNGKVRAAGPLVGISNVSLAPDGNNLTVQLTTAIYQHSSITTVDGPSSGGTS